jgi:hypothetical protein
MLLAEVKFEKAVPVCVRLTLDGDTVTFTAFCRVRYNVWTCA